MKSLHVYCERPPLGRWMSVVAALALLSLFVVVGPARAQENPQNASDLFARLQQDLSQAADAQLAAIHAQHRPQGNAVSGFGPATKLEGNRQIDRASQGPPATTARFFEPRFQSMGVDAGRIFGEVGVPPELLAVAQVESNFNRTALSPKGAFGLWQLMPSTARRYGLRVDTIRDDRADPEKATRAAARYLRDLHTQFGNWLLALAAYNAGEDLVQKAVERAGTADYWSLSNARRLPKETRNYVPAVLATAKVGENSGAWLRGQPAIHARTKGDVLFALFSARPSGANAADVLPMPTTPASTEGR